MRQQARKIAGFYVRRQADRPDITVEELQDLFFNDDAKSHTLVNSASRLANVIPGTRPFWTRQRNELEAMVKTLGSAHLFVTFSATDLH